MPEDVTQNLDLVRLFITEFLGRANTSIADITLCEQVRVISPMLPHGAILSREEFKVTQSILVDSFHETSPLEIIDQFASVDGTRVVTRFQSRGRHEKRFFGLEPTGREILFDETFVARVQNGRIIEIFAFPANLEFAMLLSPIIKPMILK